MGFSCPRPARGRARHPVSSSWASLRAGGRSAVLAIAGLVLVVVLAPAVRGQGEEERAEAAALERGKRLYRIHCLNCHGEGGRGDGPMAAILTVPMPDLTLLARGHGGTFPRQEVMGSIDGRYRIESHGAREMPVWGLSFEQRGRDAVRGQEVQQRLADLTAYLESIQQSGEPR